MAQRYETRTVEVYPNADDSASTFTLGKDEEVLDAVATRHGQRSAAVRVVIMSPTTADRCTAVTADGTRCQHGAAEGSDYCQLTSHSENTNE
jgi:hypothetical protein